MKSTKIVVIFFVICLIISGCRDLWKENIPLLLCVNDVEIKNAKTISDYGLINEGITINIYELADVTVEKFVNNENKTLPINSDTTWTNFGWYITPIDSFYKGIFNHLNWISTKNVERILQTVKNELKEENVFYAFYIRKFDEITEPLGVQIFILNPRTRILYIIVSIT
jgi:hypothetical protein